MRYVLFLLFCLAIMVAAFVVDVCIGFEVSSSDVAFSIITVSPLSAVCYLAGIWYVHSAMGLRNCMDDIASQIRMKRRHKADVAFYAITMASALLLTFKPIKVPSITHCLFIFAISFFFAMIFEVFFPPSEG